MSFPIRTLHQLGEMLDRYPPNRRARIEAHLPPELTGPLWDWLAVQCQRAIDEQLHDPAHDDPPPKQARTRSRRSRHELGRLTPTADDDSLQMMEPPVYVEALAGVEVPDTGALIRCPLPDHDDRTPSFKVYPSADQGFYCFGCHRGGRIIDFAAALYGIEPRGSGYHEIRRHLRDQLLSPLGREAA